MQPFIKTRTLPLWLFAFILAFLVIQPALLTAQEEQQRQTLTGTTMGVVTWNVSAYSSTDAKAQMATAIEEQLEFVNQSMSTYIPESEVSRFNASNSVDWFEVTLETATVVDRALQISSQTDGAFDISVQPLVQLWKFGTDKDSPTIPDDEKISELMQHVGYDKLMVRLQPPAIKKLHPKLQIDLSAIAKGYAVDQVCRKLDSLGIEDYLVEVGGEVRTSGDKPDKTPWIVGIEKPLENDRKPFQVVELFHKAMASSGDYRNFYVIDGKRFSHTIDPRTGKPVEHSVAATSVIANDCMTADALATALMVTGAEGLPAVKELGGQGLLLSRDPSGKITASASDSFPTRKEDQGKLADSGQDNSIFKTIAVGSVIFLLAIVAMSIGVIFGRERIKGSCGGIAALDNPDIKPECSLCSRATECSDLNKEMQRREQDDSDSV